MLRTDLQVIASMIRPGSTVLDVGCGDGTLLQWLQTHSDVAARGLENEPVEIARCMARGLSVVQGDAEVDLHYYPAASQDYVVLSRTLQAMHDPVRVLNRIVSIGREAIVSIPNFAYWKNRVYLGLHGRMPVTSTLSYQWYDTPNIHFCTLKDFVVLCRKHNIRIHESHMVDFNGKVQKWPQRLGLANILAEQGIFRISRAD